MLIGMLTKSKTEILLKNGAIIDRVHTGVSTIDEIAIVEVDTDKTRILDDVVFKTEIDEDKIVEETNVLIECLGVGSIEEVIINSVDEVLGTSTTDT